MDRHIMQMIEKLKAQQERERQWTELTEDVYSDRRSYHEKMRMAGRPYKMS